MTFTEFIISKEIVKAPKTKQSAKVASPFIQWVGGKRSLLEKYEEIIPTNFNNYYEPFLGGGAMFYHMQSKYGNTKQYFLSDLNRELILTYKTIATTNYQEVVRLLKYMSVRHCKEFYYAVRNYDREEIAPRRYNKLFDAIDVLTHSEIAARFLYLNLTCFNALYRVNGDNLFNVPLGNSLKKDISDNGLLRLCHDVLQDAEIIYRPYQNIDPSSGDFVFLDPPYAPLSATSNFTSYTSEEFGLSQQVELKKFCDELTKNKVKFMLANSNCEFIQNLYENYNQKTFALDRRLNCKSEGRKQVEDNEIIVYNYY
tara:strand:+ start:962 stop:1900 length:939 start_codon:yes stop_codon:yes gene_type:complete